MLTSLFICVILGCVSNNHVVSGDEVGADLCGVPNWISPNGNDCSSYIRCRNNVSELELCSQGLLFNPFLWTCDYNLTGSCYSVDDFAMTMAVTETDNIACPEDGPNIFPISSNCSQYYLCSNETAYLAECPDGLLMNPEKLTCDYAENTQCDAGISTAKMVAIMETDVSESDEDDQTGASLTENTPDSFVTPTFIEFTQEDSKEIKRDDVSSTDITHATQKSKYSSISSTEIVNVSDAPLTENNVEPKFTETTFTSVSVTEYTNNKPPTVVTVSTKQTKEGMMHVSTDSIDTFKTEAIKSTFENTEAITATEQSTYGYTSDTSDSIKSIISTSSDQDSLDELVENETNESLPLTTDTSSGYNNSGSETFVSTDVSELNVSTEISMINASPNSVTSLWSSTAAVVTKDLSPMSTVNFQEKIRNFTESISISENELTEKVNASETESEPFLFTTEGHEVENKDTTAVFNSESTISLKVPTKASSSDIPISTSLEPLISEKNEILAEEYDTESLTLSPTTFNQIVSTVSVTSAVKTSEYESDVLTREAEFQPEMSLHTTTKSIPIKMLETLYTSETLMSSDPSPDNDIGTLGTTPIYSYETSSQETTEFLEAKNYDSTDASKTSSYTSKHSSENTVLSTINANTHLFDIDTSTEAKQTFETASSVKYTNWPISVTDLGVTEREQSTLHTAEIIQSTRTKNSENNLVTSIESIPFTSEKFDISNDSFITTTGFIDMKSDEITAGLFTTSKETNLIDVNNAEPIDGSESGSSSIVISTLTTPETQNLTPYENKSSHGAIFIPSTTAENTGISSDSVETENSSAYTGTDYWSTDISTVTKYVQNTTSDEMLTTEEIDTTDFLAPKSRTSTSIASETKLTSNESTEISSETTVSASSIINSNVSGFSSESTPLIMKVNTDTPSTATSIAEYSKNISNDLPEPTNSYLGIDLSSEKISTTREPTLSANPTAKYSASQSNPLTPPILTTAAEISTTPEAEQPIFTDDDENSSKTNISVFITTEETSILSDTKENSHFDANENTGNSSITDASIATVSLTTGKEENETIQTNSFSTGLTYTTEPPPFSSILTELTTSEAEQSIEKENASESNIRSTLNSTENSLKLSKDTMEITTTDLYVSAYNLTTKTTKYSENISSGSALGTLNYNSTDSSDENTSASLKTPFDEASHLFSNSVEDSTSTEVTTLLIPETNQLTPKSISTISAESTKYSEDVSTSSIQNITNSELSTDSSFKETTKQKLEATQADGNSVSPNTVTLQVSSTTATSIISDTERSFSATKSIESNSEVGVSSITVEIPEDVSSEVRTTKSPITEVNAENLWISDTDIDADLSNAVKQTIQNYAYSTESNDTEEFWVSSTTHKDSVTPEIRTSTQAENTGSDTEAIITSKFFATEDSSIILSNSSRNNASVMDVITSDSTTESSTKYLGYISSDLSRDSTDTFVDLETDLSAENMFSTVNQTWETSNTDVPSMTSNSTVENGVSTTVIPATTYKLKKSNQTENTTNVLGTDISGSNITQNLVNATYVTDSEALSVPDENKTNTTNTESQIPGKETITSPSKAFLTEYNVTSEPQVSKTRISTSVTSETEDIFKTESTLSKMSISTLAFTEENSEDISSNSTETVSSVMNIGTSESSTKTAPNSSKYTKLDSITNLSPHVTDISMGYSATDRTVKETNKSEFTDTTSTELNDATEPEDSDAGNLTPTAKTEQSVLIENTNSNSKATDSTLSSTTQISINFSSSFTESTIPIMEGNTDESSVTQNVSSTSISDYTQSTTYSATNSIADISEDSTALVKETWITTPSDMNSVSLNKTIKPQLSTDITLALVTSEVNSALAESTENYSRTEITRETAITTENANGISKEFTRFTIPSLSKVGTVSSSTELNDDTESEDSDARVLTTTKTEQPTLIENTNSYSKAGDSTLSLTTQVSMNFSSSFTEITIPFMEGNTDESSITENVFSKSISNYTQRTTYSDTDSIADVSEGATALANETWITTPIDRNSISSNDKIEPQLSTDITLSLVTSEETSVPTESTENIFRTEITMETSITTENSNGISKDTTRFKIPSLSEVGTVSSSKGASTTDVSTTVDQTPETLANEASSVEPNGNTKLQVSTTILSTIETSGGLNLIENTGNESEASIVMSVTTENQIHILKNSTQSNIVTLTAVNTDDSSRIKDSSVLQSQSTIVLDEMVSDGSDLTPVHYVKEQTTSYQMLVPESTSFSSVISPYPTSSTSDITTKMDSVCISNNGLYPNPDDCNTFYQCSKGVAKYSECTENFHFNPIKKICEDPCLAQCDRDIECPTASEGSTVKTSILTDALDLKTSADVSRPTYQSTDVTVSTYEDNHTVSQTHYFISTVSSKPSSNELDTSTFTTSTETIEMSQSEIADLTTEKSTVPTSGTSETESSYLPLLTTNVTSEASTTISNETVGGSVTFDDMTPTKEIFTPTATLPGLTTMMQTTASQEPFTIGSASVSTSIGYSTAPTTVFLTSKSLVTEPERFSTNSEEATKISSNEHFTSHVTKSSPVTQDEVRTESYSHTSTVYVITTETITQETRDSSTLTTLATTADISCNNSEDCFTTDDLKHSSPDPYSLCARPDFLPGSKCNEFINCTQSVPERKKCPTGLYFNPTTRTCDWPNSAGCGDIANPLYEPDDSFDCPCKSCLIPSSENCQDYYLCLGYTAYRLKCSNNLLFDDSLNTCTYSVKVDCPVSSTISITSTQMGSSTYTSVSTTKQYSTTSTTGTTRIKPQYFVCPHSNGLFKNPENCETFYQCSNGRPYKMFCPGNLHFSEKTQRCEYPCDAGCNLTLSCGVSTPAPRDPRCSCRDCKLPSRDSCAKYILCNNWKARIVNCRWGQTFDEERGACDWAHRVNCRPTELCPKRNGVFPHTDDCRKFVHCSNGIPYIKPCPYKLEFDPVRQRCEWPSGRCGELPVIGKEIPIFHEEHREGWKCPQKFGYFADEEHCDKYFFCSFGTPHMKECSKGLMYNPRYLNCDWNKNVRCHSDRHRSSKRCRIYNRQVTCSSDRTTLPHTHCNMFFDCSAGVACAKQCPIGLFFNMTTGVCDLPENVKCAPHTEQEHDLKDLSTDCVLNKFRRKPDPSDEACFYRCQYGKVVAGCCSRGYFYNDRTERCERKTKRIVIRSVSQT